MPEAGGEPVLATQPWGSAGVAGCGIASLGNGSHAVHRFTSGRAR